MIRTLVAIALTAMIALAAMAGGATLVGGLAVILSGGVCIAMLSRQSGEEAPVLSTVTPPVEPDSDVETRMIEAIGEPVIIALDGRVRNANAAAKLMLGAHIGGEDLRLAIRHPAATERLATGAPDGSVELVGLGGRDQRIEMRVATLAPRTRLIHLVDRTTSYAAERARVDFVANASHELRTPLAAILGFIETLDDPDSGGDDEIRTRFLEVMFKEARRMQRLIDDLISLSRIEAEKYRLPDTPILLPALIEEVANELRDNGGARRTDVVLDIDGDVAAVVADRAQISQVIHNLVGNAFKYARPGAPVTIALDRKGGLVRLSVTDQGEGIAPEHLPRLTERFYRIDPGRSRTMGGTGLGLSIVKHIVERHRGRLDITSRLGVGTTVSVLLPAVASAAANANANANAIVTEMKPD